LRGVISRDLKAFFHLRAPRGADCKTLMRDTQKPATGPQSLARGLIGNAYLVLMLASLCWSGNHIMGRAIAGHVPPVAIATLRWLLAAAVLWPFVRHQVARDWPLVRRQPGAIVFLALLGGALFGTLQFVGLQYTSALNVSVMNSLTPVLIVLASAVMFGDRIGRLQAVGIGVSLAGVFVIITRLDPAIVGGLAFNRGDLIILLNQGLWAVYAVCLRLRAPIHWIRDAVLYHRRFRALDPRRRTDRPEPRRRVPASHSGLQRAAHRRAARRAADGLSRARFRADPRRRVVRGAEELVNLGLKSR